MRWIKKGRIFDPHERPALMRSHAQVPTPFVMHDRIRLYYADRNEHGKSFPTWIDVDIENPLEIIGVPDEPVMPYGERGFFDDEGIMPGTVLRRDSKVWMYYTGWNQGVTVPYRNATGLAQSADGGRTFSQLFPGPILDRSHDEPLMIVTPFVMVDGGTWRMWYVAGTTWVNVSGRFEPVYVIRHAASIDGIYWNRSGVICVPQKHSAEAHAHPSVIKRAGVYHMWFSYRESTDYRDGAGAYRIGYARSSDGVHFERFDEEAGLARDNDGWDSTMTCYPYVLELGNRVAMFYNGNGFGRTGIGYAELEPAEW